jgi:hypothetical protein
MSRPKIDIKETRIDCSSDFSFTINIKYKVYVPGPCKICYDLPETEPVFFSKSGSNSVCDDIESPAVGKFTEFSVSFKLMSKKKDYNSLIMKATITDGEGTSRTDVVKVNYDCS